MIKYTINLKEDKLKRREFIELYDLVDIVIDDLKKMDIIIDDLKKNKRQ